MENISIIEVVIDKNLFKEEKESLAKSLFGEKVNLPVYSKKSNYFNSLLSNYIYSKFKEEFIFEDEEEKTAQFPSIERHKQQNLLRITCVPSDFLQNKHKTEVFFQQNNLTGKIFKFIIPAIK
ncbi:MAG: hypothetical protein ABIA04_13430 [Pseudomonadota bacterium]